MALLSIALPVIPTPPTTARYVSASNEPAGRHFPETGKTLAPQFVPYFDSNGGLPVFGYPITEARTEGGYLVQWTERERLEWHPEHENTRHEVLLGLLGRELTRGFQGPRFSATAVAAPAPPGVSVTFPETGHTVREPFLSYWTQCGGLALFGYPISARHTDERGLQVQWFERARFEHHPELPDTFQVTLGLLGVEALRAAGREYLELAVGDDPVTAPGVQLGLAQGGESDDPGFFDNVRDQGARLGPALVRLDNIFNYYDVVRKLPDGTTAYRWDDLDRVIDGVRAMGKEPFICLSYMPESISALGSSRVHPPANFADWGKLVYATVHHLNIERKLGIRYWEVWNEPNQWDFWKGSFEQYLQLYDVTTEAALAADPTVKIGGPAFSNFEPVGISHFLTYQAGRGPKARVDFLSWHAYGQTPQRIVSQIREARSLLERFPQFQPELIISEFNVLQGGPGDTSAGSHTDTVHGAIGLLASVEAMQWERLDRALLFELKDGAGPRRYWGRWGVLTNDGYPKPVYHVLRTYLNRPDGMLPVTLTKGSADGTLGLMAFGSPGRSALMLWYTGLDPARVKVVMPPAYDHVEFGVTLFDKYNNNPARTGDEGLESSARRHSGDLVFDLEPASLVLLESSTR